MTDAPDWQGLIREQVRELQSTRNPQDAGRALARLHTWTRTLHDDVFKEVWKAIRGGRFLEDVDANRSLVWADLRAAEAAVHALLDRHGLALRADPLAQYRADANRVRMYLANHVYGDGSMVRPEVGHV